MQKISKEKCSSFQSYLRRYQQKSYLNYNEITHLMLLTSFHNYYEQPLFQTCSVTQNVVKPQPQPQPSKQKIEINAQLNTVSDIISLLDKYPLNENIVYSINLEMLNRVRPELEQLNAMVGMKTLKTAILDQLLFYVQGFDGSQDFKHTVLYGPPGTGKTEIAKIMGKMYKR